MTANYEVVAIGNAIVDVIARSSDSFIINQGLDKGSMALIDEARADQLYATMTDALVASGGSVANTAVGIASFGGTSAFVGKVRNDELGDAFASDIAKVGVDFGVPSGADGPGTARSLILVTPDGQRTMNTYLGIAAMLEPSDINPATVEAGSILLCEGYLWDVDSAKRSIRLAMDIAKGAGRKVALSLSDAFCIERHHQEFLELVEGPVDILLANESELRAMYECGFEQAAEKVRDFVELGCLTKGEEGSLLVQGSQSFEIKAEPVEQVVDTTGAGDQYAAGVLYGLAHGYAPEIAGRLGSLAAAEVISHMGPRPEVPLSTLLAQV